MQKKNKKKTPGKEDLSLSIVPENNGTVKAPFSQAQITLIKNTVAKGASDDELKLFLVVANKSGLDPFSKQIHFVKRKQKVNGGGYIEVGAIQTAIDGYRAIAERSGQYAGSDDIVYQEDEKGKNPIAATATVYKIVSGVRVPYTATARWKEFVPSTPNDFMWNKMPYHMLGKVAEALALRKAFPNDLSGIYVEEETQSMGSVVEAEQATVKSKKIDAPKTEVVEEPVKPVARENLFKTAREFGAEEGKEDIFIQQMLSIDIDWEHLTDRDITNLRTRLMSKLTPRNHA